jgi:hypothetical protein|tara:strand:- start:4364 stop:4927 length:564 start_codon:yes stop_codon:yes gene_type:complete
MKPKIEIVVGYSLKPEATDKKTPRDLSPYRSDIGDVHMIIPAAKKAITYRGAGRDEGSGKLRVCEAAAAFVKRHSYDVGFHPTFVGFDVKAFLRFVGFGCAVSHTFFPSSYWMDEGHTVELYEQLLLTGDDAQSPKDAFLYFSKGFTGEDLEKYTSLVRRGVTHEDAEHDAQLAFLFGSIFRLWGTH